MTKKQKKDYINSVYTTLADAKNHGRNGGNWWYPMPNVIAYNVKIWGQQKSIKDIEVKMTPKQRDYYAEVVLWEIEQDIINDACDELRQEVKEIDGVCDAWFAGRSGGWFEVEYNNPLELVDDDTYPQAIAELYREAKKVQATIDRVADLVQQRHRHFCEYLNSEAYIDDFIERLWCDEQIDIHYRNQVKHLVDKIG